MSGKLLNLLKAIETTDMEDCQLPELDSATLDNSIDLSWARQRRKGGANATVPQPVRLVFLIEKSRRGYRAILFLKRFMAAPGSLLSDTVRRSDALVAQPDNFFGKAKRTSGQALPSIITLAGPAHTMLTQCTEAAIEHLQNCQGLNWFFIASTQLDRCYLEQLSATSPEYYLVDVASG
jgi:hypothetical protein